MIALDTDSFGADAGSPAVTLAAGAALGYRAFTLGARRTDWATDRLVPALRQQKLVVHAVRGPDVELPNDRRVSAASLLAVEDADRRAHAAACLGSAMVLAARLTARALVLDLGTLPLLATEPGVDDAMRRQASRDRALDRVLPTLFDLCRVCPDLPLAVSIPERAADWPDPDGLEILVAELRGRRLGWWYDTARAHHYARETDVAPEAWLDRGHGDLLGVSLTDLGGDDTGLPLGAGEVDFGALRGRHGSETVLSVYVDPAYGPGALKEAAGFLEGMGIG